tara:strand:+ start:2453 stop:4138 length:1686 start_codon:yes stop_codon:yes gene_type:complete
MNHFNILDCTLRDGGYYTDWKFDSKLVRSLIKALDSNGVDIIELGYKSPIIGGPYRKCNDGFISSVVDFKINAKLAFMIDVKDYISDNKVNKSLIKDIIKPSSVFKICRVAAKYNEIEYLPQIVKILQDLGYEVICNLMAVSKASNTEINNYTNITRNLNLLATYIADSYGALYPKDIKKLFDKSEISGIHTHDNMGLAFANCLEAINQGATYIDGTLTGMGRGVGNVTTEQLLIHRGEINADLLDCIDQFNKMKSHYGWGTNALYHQAGKNHIHPLYMQDLNQSSISNKQLLKATDDLLECHLYDKNKLKPFLKQRAVVVIPARYKSTRFPGKPLTDILGVPMIIRVANIAEQAVGKENVYIATEDRRIVNVVEKEGYKVILTSDTCLTGTDRIAEASMEIDAEIFIDVQGDEPLLDPKYITKTIDEKKKYPNYIINCMARLESYDDIENTKIPKMVVNLDNEIIYQSRSPIPGGKYGPIKSAAKKQVCVFAFNKEELKIFADKGKEGKTPLEWNEDLEMLRFLELGMKLKGLEVEGTTHAVDVPEDVEIVENILKKLGH